MDNEDDFDVKDAYKSASEIRKDWIKLIRNIHVSRVCFYPGRQGQAPDFQTITQALPMIGDCNALVYSEPNRTKREVYAEVREHHDNPQFGIAGMGFVTSIEIINGEETTVDREVLFGHPAIDWIPPETTPPEDRFWGLYSRWRISRRVVKVLHIGIAGDAAWTYFLQPHGIKPARIIANPPYQGDL